MTRPTTGTCQGCRREQPLDDGRHVAAHESWWGSDQCRGAGKLSKEAQAASAEKSRTRTLARIETLRADAAVAHDAIATGRAWPAHQILALRAAALQEYRLKHPKVRTRRLWFTVGRGKRRSTAWGPAHVDVYCTLCRELLLQRAERGRDHTERTREHTTLCALRCLSGVAQYVAPGERRLPVAMPMSMT